MQVNKLITAHFSSAALRTLISIKRRSFIADEPELIGPADGLIGEKRGGFRMMDADVSFIVIIKALIFPVFGFGIKHQSDQDAHRSMRSQFEVLRFYLIAVCHGWSSAVGSRYQSIRHWNRVHTTCTVPALDAILRKRSHVEMLQRGCVTTTRSLPCVLKR